MYLKRWIPIAIFFALSLHAEAQVCLTAVPDTIRSAVELDNWTIIGPQDLAEEDRPIFKGNHPGQCPGVASGDFHPKADSSFIVALIKEDDQKHRFEKTLIVMLKKNRIETAVIIPPTQVNAVSVVWKLPPGHWRGLDGTRVVLSRDSFVSEQNIAAASQYYYDGSHLKSFVISR
jgi:hypothetical protein